MDVNSGMVINENQCARVSVYQKFKNLCSYITVEPLLMCFLLADDIANVSIQNLYLEKACRGNLNFSGEICDALANRDSAGYNKSEEVSVQQLVAHINIWKDLLLSVFPLILLLFLGSWSDRNCNRKACIIFPLTGKVISGLGLLLATYFFEEIPIEATAILEALPVGITGSSSVLFMGVFSFVQAISTDENKTLRTGIVYVVFWGCIAIGSGLSGILYQMWGFCGVFSFTTSVCFIGILYGVFIVKEDKSSLKEKNVSFLSDFLDITHIKNMGNMVLYEGDRKRRIKMWFIIIITLLLNATLRGNMEVVYLFSRLKFKWNEVDYGIFLAVGCVVHLLGNAFALGFFSKLLKCNDALLGVIASSSRVFGLLVYPFAPTSKWFYSGILAEVFMVTNLVALRSIASKLVSTNELGKMNSLIAIFDAMASLIFGPIYNAVYKATVDTFPGTFYVLGAGLTIPVIIIFLCMYVQDKLKSLRTSQNGKI